MQSLTNFYTSLSSRYGKKRVLVGTLLIVVLGIVGITKIFGTEVPETVSEVTARTVTVAPVDTLMGASNAVETLGTVEAVREARLVTEASGRVTSVPVKLGDVVGAGAVIASIENSSERASVLQAQGSYEAARAAAATSDVGSASADRAYREALTQATNAYRGAFATADDVLRNTVDQVFSQPDTTRPGVRIDSQGSALELSSERVALESLFNEWAQGTQGEISGNVGTLLSKAESNTMRLATLVSTLTTLLADDDAFADETELTTLRDDFAAARTTVNSVLQTLSTSRSSLISARTQQEQASIAATNGNVSLAEAQVKQALGALRLTQSNLEKTIVRSPISGTVNSLTLKEGTTVGIGVPAAIISSEGGLEVVAYVNESDARLITVGAPVTIEDNGSGVVTQIASAIDSLTKKIEVRVGISLEDNILTNSESVRLAIATEADPANETTEIRLPVIAIKMTPEGPVVFSVNNENKLVPHPVTLGAIGGDTVVTTGIDSNLTIVTDARGLRADEVVTIK